MKVIRRLCRRGNSFHVSMPPQMIDELRLKVRDGVVVELTDHHSIELRRVQPRDLNAVDIPALNFDLPRVGSK
jgi:antitoxin component of MazEF toxin-antitoxin module